MNKWGFALLNIKLICLISLIFVDFRGSKIIIEYVCIFGLLDVYIFNILLAHRLIILMFDHAKPERAACRIRKLETWLM